MNAMYPGAGETVTVTVPSLRTLKVVRFTSEETGEFYAPVSDVRVNTAVTQARTVRPGRR